MVPCSQIGMPTSFCNSSFSTIQGLCPLWAPALHVHINTHGIIYIQLQSNLKMKSSSLGFMKNLTVDPAFFTHSIPCVSHQYLKVLSTWEPTGHTSLDQVGDLQLSLNSISNFSLHTQSCNRPLAKACPPLLPPFPRDYTKPYGRHIFTHSCGHSQATPILAHSHSFLLAPNMSYLVPETMGVYSR